MEVETRFDGPNAHEHSAAAMNPMGPMIAAIATMRVSTMIAASNLSPLSASAVQPVPLLLSVPSVLAEQESTDSTATSTTTWTAKAANGEQCCHHCVPVP